MEKLKHCINTYVLRGGIPKLECVDFIPQICDAAAALHAALGHDAVAQVDLDRSTQALILRFFCNRIELCQNASHQFAQLISFATSAHLRTLHTGRLEITISIGNLWEKPDP